MSYWPYGIWLLITCKKKYVKVLSLSWQYYFYFRVQYRCLIFLKTSNLTRFSFIPCMPLMSNIIREKEPQKWPKNDSMCFLEIKFAYQMQITLYSSTFASHFRLPCSKYLSIQSFKLYWRLYYIAAKHSTNRLVETSKGTENKQIYIYSIVLRFLIVNYIFPWDNIKPILILIRK